VISIGRLVSIWFLVSVPASLFLGRFIRAGRGGERKLPAMAESVEKNGVILTFCCGPLGSQVVEVNVGSEQRRITLTEFCDLLVEAQHGMAERIRTRVLIR